MKWLQEVTVWSVPCQNHVYYMNDSMSHAVGYISHNTGQYKKFVQPMQIDIRRRKFTELNRKAEPDTVYFPKKTQKKQSGIEVQGSGGKKYFLNRTPSGWSCTCPGFQFRRVCKHSTEIANKK